jgi:hypothetical protein
MLTRQVRVYPTRKQRVVLSRWMGVVRWTYNRCVAAVKTHQIPFTKKPLRTHAVTQYPTSPVATQNQTWVTDVPYEIRDAATVDLINAEKTVDANQEHRQRQMRNRTKFKFRSKKDRNQSVTVLKKNYNRKRGVFIGLLGSSVLRTTDRNGLPSVLVCDSQLVKNRLGHYYMCMPQPFVMVHPNNVLDLARLPTNRNRTRNRTRNRSQHRTNQWMKTKFMVLILTCRVFSLVVTTERWRLMLVFGPLVLAMTWRAGL